ncbi:MAG: helix-turn-helix domain-containing protein, partial [Chloroflexaceae bacterium]|nr:helix-turn-helix domain-containing protein [Chloroflexaceae bacterium]
ATFRDWVRHYDMWRDFVFELVSQRLAHVLALVDEVAFRRMDSRVAALLLVRIHHENPLRITHAEIAAELGSSREVISRILEDFAARGLTRSGRGTLEVLDPQALQGRVVG